MLADVRDEVAIDRVFARVRPHVAFHAAAHKHVPMLQGQLREAFRNNVLGTRIVSEASVAAGSMLRPDLHRQGGESDIGDGCLQAAGGDLVPDLSAAGAHAFITVRFGNVLDSAGSVVPLFRQQIQQGGQSPSLIRRSPATS